MFGNVFSFSSSGFVSRFVALFVLVVAVGLVASSCSSDDSQNRVASIEASQAASQDLEVTDVAVVNSSEDAVQAFTVCLRVEGLEVDDPQVDDRGNLRPPKMRDIINLDHDVAEAAFVVCQPLLEGVTFGFADEDRSEMNDMFLEFAQCARDNGFEMDDPNLSSSQSPGSGSGGGGPFAGIDRDDPDFQAALAACEYVFVESGRTPGSGGGQG